MEHLRVGFVPGTEGKVFPQILPALRAERPGIRLLLRGLTSPEQIVALQKGSIDVGILRPPVDDRGLQSVDIFEEELLAAVPSSHDITRKTRLQVSELAAIPFIQVAREHAPAVHDAVRQIAEAAGVRFSAVLETDSISGALNAVGAGLGFSIQPDCVRQYSPATVALRPLVCEPTPRIALVAAWRRADSTPALRLLLELLRDWIAAGRPPRSVRP